MKVKVPMTKLAMLSIAAGFAIIVVNFFFLSSDVQLFTILNFAGGLMIVGIPIAEKYRDFSSKKNIELKFPLFLSGLTENIKIGMTLPQAIKSAADSDYDKLTPHIKEMSAKISWGIPFERVLTDFARKIGSESIIRTVQTIIEAHKSGGKIDTVLENSAESLSQLEKIKKERSVSVYSQMINGYMIYIIFLGVMIGLSSFLLPAFQSTGSSQGVTNIEGLFDEVFRVLVGIQAVFAGIAIGKMSEGSIFAGIKHSLVLATIGYSSILFFL